MEQNWTIRVRAERSAELDHKRAQMPAASSSSGAGRAAERHQKPSGPAAGIPAAELFVGAGGLALGLEAAGFETVLAVEIDRDACDTISALMPKIDLRQASVEAIDFRRYRRKLCLLSGGPPCQPYSIGGKQEGRDDERDFMPEFIRAVEEAEPAAFLLENVPGLALGDNASYFKRLIARFAGLGYSVTWRIINAADYGVPQKRRRLFVVGLRNGEFRFPEPTHGDEATRPHVPAGSVLRADAVIGDANKSIVVYAKNPDPRPSPYDGHLFNGGGRPIDLTKPSPTILAAAGGNKTHFIDTCGLVPEYHRHLMAGGAPKTGTLPGGRRLTVQESALVQTFPEGMRFAGSRSSQYTQIGNAVPPKLAAILASAVARALRSRE